MSTGRVGQRMRVGLFEIDLAAAELFKNGRRVGLQEQPFRVLAILLERPGELVTRKDLQTRLWPADTYVSFDEGLNTAVRKLRTAFDDSADNPRFIQTVPRRGYRFIAPVARVDSQSGLMVPASAEEPDGVIPVPDPSVETSRTEEPVSPNAEEAHELSPSSILETNKVGSADEVPAWQADGSTTRSARSLMVGTLLLILGVALAMLFATRMRSAARAFSPRPEPASSRLAAIRSIAVLPLENLSADPGQEYFADGMTDQLITDLGQIQALRVISRTSVMQYKGAHRPIQDVARELKVDAIVEGTVLRSGDQVRITAQLIEVPLDKHLWAESYVGDLHDVLGFQNSVASAIAQEIQVTLTPREKAQFKTERPVNPDAYEHYLLGRYFWNKRDGGGLQKAADNFKKAIEIDPTYAPAYAGLAQSYLLQAGNPSSKEEALAAAEQAARRAIMLDPSSAEGHTALAGSYANQYKLADEEREYKEAVKLNPNYATGHHWYGEGYLLQMGRFREAEWEMRQAMLLDPASRIIATDWGVLLYTERRYDEAYQQLSKVLEMDDGFSEAYLWRGRVLLQQGKYPDAIRDLEMAYHINPASATIRPTLGYAYGLSGNRNAAQKLLNGMLAEARTKYVAPWAIGLVYLGLGEKRQCMEWLRKAVREHSTDMLAIRVAPEADVLRREPGYSELLAEMKLPD